ncbi:DUF429 domain-containing protein [Thalassobacillus hwangdonensis]|uniref:DUF429 domain-containing protein n=1 Tax=Thalassobacillus hwangdonensis TaxID=546108 RepID=A0ABW3L4T7_9BACI
MKIIGIDLSGPGNHKDTAVAVFSQKGERLLLDDLMLGASDEDIITTLVAAQQYEDIAVAIDAPLSYQDGGGDRPQDKQLRKLMKDNGLNGSSVMPPTLTRMAYLTLRGISLTRRIMMTEALNHLQVAEVHPGAAIGTRLEDKKHALLYKKELDSRIAIAEWFPSQGIEGLPISVSQTSHTIDACAAALAAWCWIDPNKEVKWVWKKTSEENPFALCF